MFDVMHDLIDLRPPSLSQTVTLKQWHTQEFWTGGAYQGYHKVRPTAQVNDSIDK